MAQEQLDIKKMNEELMALKKKVAALSKILEEDLEFSRRIEEAYQRHDNGDFIEMPQEDFLKELEKW